MGQGRAERRGTARHRPLSEAGARGPLLTPPTPSAPTRPCHFLGPRCSPPWCCPQRWQGHYEVHRADKKMKTLRGKRVTHGHQRGGRAGTRASPRAAPLVPRPHSAGQSCFQGWCLGEGASGRGAACARPHQEAGPHETPQTPERHLSDPPPRDPAV